jgi:hypothetical protein
VMEDFSLLSFSSSHCLPLWNGKGIQWLFVEGGTVAGFAGWGREA